VGEFDERRKFKGDIMRKTIFRTAAICLILAGLVLGAPGMGICSDAAREPGNPLLSVGKIGPGATDLQAWIDRPQGTGEEAPVTVHLKASRAAYVVAIYVSATGDAVVLFPSRETPDNLIQPGKEYTLFGGDSKIKLKVSEKAKEPKIVFYASPKPLNLEPLKIPDGQYVIKIPQTAVADMNVLTTKIEEMAKEEGFNRKVLALKTGEQGETLKLMGLPDGYTSRKTRSITGVQGMKDDAVDKPDMK
jgi:hypothetical protein